MPFEHQEVQTHLQQSRGQGHGRVSCRGGHACPSSCPSLRPRAGLLKATTAHMCGRSTFLPRGTWVELPRYFPRRPRSRCFNHLPLNQRAFFLCPQWLPPCWARDCAMVSAFFGALAPVFPSCVGFLTYFPRSTRQLLDGFIVALQQTTSPSPSSAPNT